MGLIDFVSIWAVASYALKTKEPPVIDKPNNYAPQTIGDNSSGNLQVQGIDNGNLFSVFTQ